MFTGLMLCNSMVGGGTGAVRASIDRLYDIPIHVYSIHLKMLVTHIRTYTHPLIHTPYLLSHFFQQCTAVLNLR